MLTECHGACSFTGHIYLQMICCHFTRTMNHPSAMTFIMVQELKVGIVEAKSPSASR